MKIKKHALKILLAVILLGSIYSVIEPYWIEEKNNIIQSADIPAEFDNLKIIFISDIHLGPFFSQNRLKNLVTTLNNKNADVIILGGDYVHQNKKYIKPCFDELKKITAKYGTYAVLGNHDHWESKNEMIENINRAHIRLIDNNAFWIKLGSSGIKIGGVGDYMEDKQDIKPTINDVSRNDYVILVSHNPDYIEELKIHKYSELIDLILCGHTHGGQVSFFGLYAPIIPSSYGQKYRSGQKRINNMDVIISNGIGTITPPIRFFVRPQINIIQLKIKNAT